MTNLAASPSPRLFAHGAAAGPRAERSLRILFLVSAHSLSQRARVALSELGHRVAVEVVDSGGAMESAVAAMRPS